MTLLRIAAPHFVAGVIVGERAAPIIWLHGTLVGAAHPVVLPQASAGASKVI